jgi:hypothetical protein
MSVIDCEDLAIVQQAYRLAWASFNALQDLTPDERRYGPRKLRDYIDALVASGERDPNKIALSALGLIREYEQIIRSYARISSPSIEP